MARSADRKVSRSWLRGLARTFAVAALLATFPAGAQTLPDSTREAAQDGPATGEELAPPPGDTLRGDTPRSAMRGFLEASRADDFERAASYLDLGAVAPGQRKTRGPELARQLKRVLDRELWVELDALSNDPDGFTEDGLPGRRDLVGTLESADGPVDIAVERVRGDEPPLWRIASSTVRRIPALYAEFGPGPLEARLPPALVERHWFEMALWQWIALALIVPIAAAIAFAVTWMLSRIGARIVARIAPGWDEHVVHLLRGPVRLGVGVAVFAGGIGALSLSVPAERLLSGIARGLTVVATTWFVLRFVDVFADRAEHRFRLRANLPAASAVPLLRRVAKAVLILIAGLAFAQNLGADITGVIAGLGIGGLAVALAAQKTMENLFGGFSLVTDQPIRAGDFCRVGSWLGVVHDVGLRSTRIRTLDRTVVTIPNAAVATMELENYTRRDKIFFHPYLNLRYETSPDQLRWLLVAIKRLLLSHPMVDPEPARVRFVDLGAHSLDLEIFAYVKTTDYDQFLAVQEDLLLRIMDLVAESGTGFAFPSQTIYAAPDAGLDATRGRRAESEVETWRQRGELPLPWVPRRRAAEWASTLDYPPEGAARD